MYLWISEALRRYFYWKKCTGSFHYFSPQLNETSASEEVVLKNAFIYVPNSFNRNLTRSKDSPTWLCRETKAVKMWQNSFVLVVFKLLPFIFTVVYSISPLQWETEIAFPCPGHCNLICSFYLAALLVQQPIAYSPNSHFKIFLRLWAFLLPISRIHLLGSATDLCQLRQAALG